MRYLVSDRLRIQNVQAQQQEKATTYANSTQARDQFSVEVVEIDTVEEVLWITVSEFPCSKQM